MKQGFEFENVVNEEGFPAGGYANGVGIEIEFQNGPLLKPAVPEIKDSKGKITQEAQPEERLAPNGAFVEDLIGIIIERIEFYQTAANGKFYCGENVDALRHLKKAAGRLDDRTKDRTERKVEGTHTA